MTDLNKLLKKHEACSEAVIFFKDMTIEEAFNNCPRGEWLLWLFSKTNPDDLRLLTLAKGHCANTVRHLMKDERSTKSVDVAIKFGEGKATIEELNAAAAAGYAAADAAGYADTAGYAAARKENQQKTAEICRKYLPLEKWGF